MLEYTISISVAMSSTGVSTPIYNTRACVLLIDQCHAAPVMPMCARTMHAFILSKYCVCNVRVRTCSLFILQYYYSL